MNSMFSNAAFSRFDLGSHVRAKAAGLPRATLAQGIPSAYSITDYLAKVGLDPAEIDKISDPAFRAQYKDEYAKCQEKGLTSTAGLGCLAALGVKVYAKLQEEEKKPAGTMSLPQSQKSEFPIIPVAIGAAGVLGLIYYLVTKGN